MPDNQFSVKVPNALEALMAGEQGYKDVRSAQKDQQTAAVRDQAAKDLMQGGNPQDAMARLMGIGDYQGASTLATVIHNKSQEGYQQQQLGLQGQQLAETSRHNKASEANAAEDKGKPSVIGFGGSLVDRTGKVLYQNNTGVGDNGSSFDDPTLTAMAKQYIAGDTSVLQNLGRGAQGAADIRALRKKVADINNGAGETGAEQANRNAEFFGVKAGQRTLGTKQANIEMASTEFEQVLPIVAEASKAVSRTNYPDLNKIIQAYQEKTGDPNIVRFGGGINTLINLYGRAISPNGVATVSDKDHAREILTKAWAQGQFDAATGMMVQEINAAKNSPEKVRDEMRKRFLSGQSGTKPAAAPASNLPPPPPGFVVQ